MESNIIIKMDTSGKKTSIINPNVSKVFVFIRESFLRMQESAFYPELMQSFT